MMQPEPIHSFMEAVKNLTMSNMKKIFFTVAFVIGVDVLDFPRFCRHHLIDKIAVNSKFYKAYSKK